MVAEAHNDSTTRINDTFRHSGPILIQQLDQPGATIDPASLLINEPDSLTDLVHYNLESYHSMEDNESLMSFRIDEKVIESNDREIIYWLPIHVCEVNIQIILF